MPDGPVRGTGRDERRGRKADASPVPPTVRTARGEAAAAASCSLDMVLTPAEPAIDPSARGRDRVWAAVVAAACFAVFYASPVDQVGDSRYTLLLADQLLRERSFDLAPRLSRGAHPTLAPGVEMPYQLAAVGPRVYYDFSPASAVFSVPFVPVLGALGLRFLPPDGGYDPHAEQQGQKLMAALLTSLAAAAFFAIARTVAPRGASLVVALAGALGTPAWSTASRALWSHTWPLLFASLGILLLLRALAGAGAWRPVALGCLWSAASLARPTFAIPLVAVGALLVWRAPRSFPAFALTVAAWAAVLVAYARTAFGTWLPHYFTPLDLSAEDAPMALLGTWLSPSRGFLLYVPVAAFVVYAAIRYPPRPDLRPLRLLSAAVIVGHTVLLSTHPLWWGGHCYGPRCMTDVVPWFVLLATLALDGRSRAPDGDWTRLERATALGLTVLSVGIHARGALSAATHEWNDRPQSVDVRHDRLWDWRRPQMLAGWLDFSPPGTRPLAPGQTLDLRGPENDRYLGNGWSGVEQMQRWALGPSADLTFELTPEADALLRLDAEPYLVPGRLPERDARVELNGHPVGGWRLRYTGQRAYSVRLPRAALGRVNHVRLLFPGASPTPVELGQGEDPRRLALAVRTIRLERLPSLPRGIPMPFAGNAAAPYLGTGWSEPEALMRWTEGPLSEIWFRDAETAPGILRLALNAYVVPGYRERQRVRIELNGWTAADLELTDAALQTVSAILPDGALAQDNLVRLHLPDAPGARPADAQLDPRPLAVAVRSLTIEDFPRLPTEGALDPQSADADAFLIEGWEREDASRPSRRFALGPRARLAFALDRLGARVLRLDLEPFLAPPAQPVQSVQPSLNGVPLAPLVLRADERDEYPIAVPPGVLARHNVLALELPDARSPQALGLGADRRKLGIVVHGVSLE
jgi:hypothetical protein